jgi:hypothetical protein
MPIGTFNTSSTYLPTDLAKKSFSAMITRLMPNGQAPLFGMTSMLKEETAYQYEHGYFSKTMIFPSLTSTAGDLIGATTLTVTDTTNFVPGMVVRVDTTGENILILTVASATTVTVRRAVGTQVAVAIGAAAKMWMVGNAYEEASVRPASLLITAVRNTNYTQIFRNTWAVSGTASATSLIAGGTADAESKQDCAMFHAIDIEKALIYGQKYQGTLNSQPLHTMEGLIANITANASGNIASVAAGCTWTQLESYLDPVFQQVTDPKNPNMRALFVGGIARRVIHAVARLNSTYYIQGQTTEWGLQFDTIKTPRGAFNIIEHPLFNAYGATTTWAKMAVIVDLSSFGLAYMQGRKTHNSEFDGQGRQSGDSSTSGVDAVGGTLTTELTCLIKNPLANGQLLNFTTAGLG